MNKIDEIENNTKKILESGFIEAFIEHYVEIKDIDETENTRLIYLMCNDIEEKKVITLNQIDKTKSIIKDIGFSTLSFAYIDNMKRNLKLENSNSWINRFADEFKDNIIHFQTISYLFENTYNFKDEKFTDEVKVALFQEHYEHDSYLKYKPLIKDVNILLEKEDELIDDILYLIEDYQKNECWDIDILSIEHFRKYNTSIDVLFKLSELLFQLKQLSMYNEFLNYEKEEKIIKQEKKKYSEFERTLRGLNMIKSIFESQFKKASVNILDSPLIHSDGCYLCGYFNIISNDETLSLSEFKNHYSKRYEKAKRNSLFINELKELKELAQQNLEFYNNELTEKSKIVKEFYKNLPTEYVEKQAYLNEHSALVVLLNLNVSDIKFGSNLNWSVQLNHCFTSTNEDLSIICTNIIQFIDKLEFEEVKEVVLNELESKELEKENKTCYTEIGETLSKYLIDNKITIDVAALYCVYQSIEVTEHNGKEIILHFKNTSGRKLYQRFSFFNTTENRRITDLHSKTKLNNRIKQITKLLDLLEENYKIHAQKDLDFLRKKFDEDYG